MTAVRDRHSERSGDAARDLRVRVAVASDNALLAEIGARTFFDTFAADNDSADMDAYLSAAFGPAVQAAELAEPGTTFLIAELGDEPVGYARLRRDPAPESIPGARRIEIVRFYAEQAWIGRGIGKMLMSACLEIARDERRDTIWLDVWERNDRAIRFYRRWGFEVVGDQDFVVGSDVQHDLLMARAVALT